MKNRFLAEFGLIILMTGCSGPQMKDEVDEVVTLPESFAHKESAQEQVERASDAWCTSFGPELDELVDKALTHNLDIRVAWARLEQAEAIAAQADASLFPTISAQASASRSKTPAPTPLGNIEGNTYQLSVPASYEIDLFGKLAAQREATSLDALAVRTDVETIAMSVSAQLAESWLDVTFQRERVRLLEAQIETSERFLELTLLRLSQGLASALDVNQQKVDIRGLSARKQQAELAEKLALLRLSVLLGSSDVVPVKDAEIPELGAPLAAGEPASILQQRPDVRAAMIRLEAADARTAQAARDRLPTLRLSANLFVQAAELGNLFDDLFWSIGAQATQPIFEGGRRQARVDQQVAQARERLYIYAQTVLKAFQEVEASLAQESAQARLVLEFEEQRKLAETSLDLARDRYRSGALDYLRVLTALRSLQSAEQSLLDAQRQQFSYRVQSCRAIGGDWTSNLVSVENDHE